LPDGDQFGHPLAGFGNRTAQQRFALRLAAAHAARVEVFPQARGVGRAAPVHQPAERGARDVQPGEGKAGEQPKHRDEHEFCF